MFLLQPATSSRISSTAGASGSRDADSEDIMRTLLHHEKKPGSAAVNTLLSVANDRLSSSSSDDEMDHIGPQKSFIRQQSAQSAG